MEVDGDKIGHLKIKILKKSGKLYKFGLQLSISTSQRSFYEELIEKR